MLSTFQYPFGSEYRIIEEGKLKTGSFPPSPPSLLLPAVIIKNEMQLDGPRLIIEL